MRISKRTVLKFVNGDADAIGEVFEEYKNLLYFIIASYIPNPDDCDDLLSETYIKAIEHRSELKDLRKIKAFLSRIAKNEALQFLRKNHSIPFDTIEEMYGEEDRINSILDLFGPLLNNKETIVVYYRAVFSYSWKEIVSETGIPMSSAKAIYAKAKEKLRKELL